MRYQEGRWSRSVRLTIWAALAIAVLGSPQGVLPALAQAAPQRAIRMIQNLNYNPASDSDPVLNAFDLYLPEGKTNFPILLFIHGGGWQGGDKVYEGIEKIVNICVDQGIGVMSPNYRLSPAIRHPRHIQDVAMAFAWLHANAARYGADPNRIFVAGGSTGGHLAALLALDERYLKAHNLSPKMIQGVMLYSGIYDLANFPEALVTRRKQLIFGTSDYQTTRDASPAIYVGKLGQETPPFLIAYTDNDNFDLGEQARSLYSLFLQYGLRAELLEQPGRVHATKTSGIWERLEGTDDVLGAAIDRFLRSVTNKTFGATAQAVWPPKGATEPPLKVLKDIQYYKGPGADPKLNALDLHLPENQENFPLVFFVHGGGWRAGAKEIPDGFIKSFARLGIGVASVNYRLSPAVQHPVHIQDVARAFAWTYQNAAQYKIDRNRIVIAGTSAGGHLVSLLALNKELLAAEGVPADAIKGVASMSGVYDMAGFSEPGLVPTRKEQGFGTDAALLKQASPLTYVRGDAPPFLLTFTGWELFMIPQEALQMYHAMLQKGARVEMVKVPGRTHYDQLDGIGKKNSGTDDVLGLAVTRFVLDLVRAPGASPALSSQRSQP